MESSQVYKPIGKVSNPDEFEPLIVALDHSGFRISGYDSSGNLWQTSFPGYVCHMYWQESFIYAVFDDWPEPFCDVYECFDSEFLTSFAEAGGEAEGLRHFTYATDNDYFDIIASHPPKIEKISP